MSTLKANKYQHVDRSSPSIEINSDGSVSISSTVTYEDVTSVDSVGMVTARTGLRATAGGLEVTAGVSTFNNGLNVTGNITNGLNVSAGIATFAGALDVNSTTNFADDVVFTGAAANVTWDKSTDDLIFNDNAQAKFGTDGDLSIYHDGSNNTLKTTTGHLFFDSQYNQYFRNQDGSENRAIFAADGSCSLYHDNTLRLITTTSGISVSDELNVVGLTTIGGDVSIADKIIHTGDTNTALRFPAADTFSVETGGSERARITSAGSVGINTTSPNRRFTLYQDATTRMNLKSLADSSVGIEFGDPDDENIGYMVYDNSSNYLAFGVNAGERLRITSAGKVCINNDTANADLHVCTAGSSEEDGTLRIGGSASGLGLVIDYDQSGATTARISANDNYNSDTSALKICSDLDDNPNQLVLLGSGKIGINTAVPGGTLEIADTGEYQLILKDSNNSGDGAEMAMGFKDSGNTIQGILGFNLWSTDEFYMTNQSNGGAIVFSTSDGTVAERMRVASTGEVTVKGRTQLTSSTTVYGGTVEDFRIGLKHFRSVYFYTGETSSPFNLPEVVPNASAGEITIVAGWANANGVRISKTAYAFSGGRSVSERYNFQASASGVSISLGALSIDADGDIDVTFSDNQGDKIQYLRVFIEYFKQTTEPS